MSSRHAFPSAPSSSPKPLWRSILLVVSVAVFALFWAFFCYALVSFKAYKIPSQSMAPTLIKGDHIMVKRRDPIERGAVMVFKDLATSSGEGTADVVKRVVAVSGDLVAVRSGHVILNGAAINEPYLDYETETGIDFGPVTVPREAVFILGDNRGHSFDSRYYEVPFVPTSAALGKVLFVYFSAHDTGRIGLQVR